MYRPQYSSSSTPAFPFPPVRLRPSIHSTAMINRGHALSAHSPSSLLLHAPHPKNTLPLPRPYSHYSDLVILFLFLLLFLAPSSYPPSSPPLILSFNTQHPLHYSSSPLSCRNPIHPLLVVRATEYRNFPQVKPPRVAGAFRQQVFHLFLPTKRLHLSPSAGAEISTSQLTNRRHQNLQPVSIKLACRPWSSPSDPKNSLVTAPLTSLSDHLMAAHS